MESKRVNEEIRIAENLQKIKNRVLVFSGKGGVGKSTVAANLGLALSERQLRVGLVDVDIHGPNLAKMLGAEGKRLEPAEEHKIIPFRITKHLSIVSVSFFLQQADNPVIWRGPLKMKLIQQFLGDVVWGELDWLIIDSPPGTGDEPLSIAQLIPATGAIVVTTPQEVSLMDSRKAVNFARVLKLRVYGIVENMSGLTCPHCGKMIDIFRKGGGEKAARELGVPFLGKIPMDPTIVELADEGKPFVTHNPDSAAAKAFNEIIEKVITLSQPSNE
ncbi:ATP-binding protein [candidate division WOR_3 bacterium SM23_42]|uniref:Iron-sulfur cluster carrier protein n=1 Tax=candidate division WOR_3 bacterium SM23_42 TaxID=1703779 RepID=A0A0S8FXH0_UNCW3|nr:MAG: ATP-binding protein [candidate division WOR_3 bacterium SM23_42]